MLRVVVVIDLDCLQEEVVIVNIVDWEKDSNVSHVVLAIGEIYDNLIGAVVRTIKDVSCY